MENRDDYNGECINHAQDEFVCKKRRGCNVSEPHNKYQRKPDNRGDHFAEALEEAYNEGYKDGYCDGGEDGREKGQEEAYDEGYKDGYEKAKQEVLDYIKKNKSCGHKCCCKC